MSTAYTWLIALLVLICQSGCGGAVPYEAGGEVAQVSSSSVSVDSVIDSADLQADASQRDVIEKKIIYVADLQLEVTSFDGVPDNVSQLVETFDAYIASSNLSGVSGEQRTGRWEIKVPVSRYAELLSRAQSLGELQSLDEQTTEVTAQYYDLEARIRSRKAEEERMLQHLAEDTKTLEETLAVEKELTRIREDVERLQGQMRLLTHQTDYSTVNLSIIEYQGFQTEERLAFGVELTRSFQESIRLIVEFFREFTLIFVALAPWLLLFGVPLYLLRIRVRKLLTKSW